jgi:DNA-binding transcriptional MerR regulator
LDKAPDAFRTISEVADDLDIPQHVLRFWETRFSQIKPMKRSGGRRYYRPDDVDLLRGIRRLLYGEGYTIRGVQRILKEHGIKSVQGLADGSTATSFGPVEDRASRSTVEDDQDDTQEADATDEDEGDSDDEAEFEAAPSHREPERRAPAFEEDIALAGARAEQRELDTERLKSALSELVACRKLLDDVLKDG